MGLAKAYMIFYNVVQTVGWFYLFFLLVTNLDGDLYKSIELPLKLFQTAAVLEILHACVGLVRSNPVLTGFQVFSRVFVTWAIVHSFVDAQMSKGLPMLLAAWTITEIIRYGYYALNLVECNPPIVTWLRYTLFIGLYPLGVTGELLCCFNSLSYVSKHHPYTISLPNSLNFTFDFYYVLIAIMFSYIPIFPQLYLHMFAQRKKIIGGGAKQKNHVH